MFNAQPPHNSNDTIDLSHQLQPHQHGLSSARAAQLLEQRPSRFPKRIATFGQIWLWQIVRPLRLLSLIYLIFMLLYSMAWQDHTFSLSLALVIGLILVLTTLRAAFFFRLLRRQQAQQNAAMPDCTVVRDGTPSACRPEQLVPGDLIELSAGTILPAEAIVVEQLGLELVERKGTDWQPIASHALGLARSSAGCVVMHGRGRAVIEAYPEELPAARLIKTSDQAWFRNLRKLPAFVAWLQNKQRLFDRSPFWWESAMLPALIQQLYAGAIGTQVYIMILISPLAISLNFPSVPLWCGLFLVLLLEQIAFLQDRPDLQSQDGEKAQMAPFLFLLGLIYIVWMFFQEGQILSVSNYGEIRAALIGLLFFILVIWLFDPHQERELGQAAVYKHLLELEKSGMLARNPALFGWLEGKNCLMLDLDTHRIQKLELERAIYSGGVHGFEPNQALPNDAAFESLLRSVALSSICFVDQLDQADRSFSDMLAQAVGPALQQLGIERATIEQRYSYLSENRELSFPARELLLGDTDNPKRVMELICGDYEQVIRYCDTILEGSTRQTFTKEHRQALEAALAAAYADGLLVIAFAYRLHGGSSQTINLKEAARFVGMLCFKAQAAEAARQSITTLRSKGLELVWMSQQPLQLARATAHALGLANKQFELIDCVGLQQAGRTKLSPRINSVYVGASPAQKAQIVRIFPQYGWRVFALWNTLSDIRMPKEAELSIVLDSQQQPSLHAMADLAVRSPRINSLQTLFTARDHLRLNLVKRLQFWLIAGPIQMLVCFVALITWRSSWALVQFGPILLLLAILHSLLSWALISEPDEEIARQELNAQIKKPFWFGLAPLNLICSGILSLILPFVLLAQIQSWGAAPEQQLIPFGVVMILLQVFTALTCRRSYQAWYSTLGRNKSLLYTVVIGFIGVTLLCLTPLQSFFLGESIFTPARFGTLLLATSSVLWQGELWRWIWRLKNS